MFQVGIHTGTVLCGIVGKRRFKFDVWSNDVTLANKMESTGKPGMVHISHSTYTFLKDQYFVLDGDPVGGESTFLNSLESLNDASAKVRNWAVVAIFHKGSENLQLCTLDI